jgi:archaellum component FlaD/FlaE
MGDAW